MYELNDSDLGISAARGQLAITVGQDVITATELSLNDYSVFLGKWQLAMNHGQDRDLANCWTESPVFRKLLRDCLGLLGINPDSLKVSQLEALVLTYQGGPGILFNLHNTYPKPLAPRQQKTSGKISLSTWLKWLNNMPTNVLMALIRVKIGHLVESWPLWLTVERLKSWVTLMPWKPTSNISGPRKSRTQN